MSTHFYVMYSHGDADFGLCVIASEMKTGKGLVRGSSLSGVYNLHYSIKHGTQNFAKRCYVRCFAFILHKLQVVPVEIKSTFKAADK